MVAPVILDLLIYQINFTGQEKPIIILNLQTWEQIYIPLILHL